ncbi:SDR family NAD(P)-dependent oxidoreductase [Streptomyces sp. NBC_01716]|uniref:SDR family NAD(P)-dependent oxidoreductase n=1 Tax=Streptomyces sp. NBC_01716 TaxID=2975917 RepID=UPI002E327D0A|nr:SDR family NAD(P)-dependent oxidoreductase [Streptomyces sp. NBC_01716]
MDELKGKVAVVTGAGQGIGRAEARALARAGAHVIVNDVGRAPGRPAAEEAVEEIRGAGGSAEANGDDISTWDGAERLIGQAVGVRGKLDLLVCNAGIIRDRTIVNISEAEWDAVMAVHLKGHAGPLHFAAAHWKSLYQESGEQVEATVVTTSSEAGLYGNFGQVNYSAAKAGIVALTQVAARELARYGVRANSICPRARTGMTEGVVEGMEPVEGAADEWDPESVAALTTFLGSRYSRGITGQVFVVHGPTVSRMREWTPADEITGDSSLRLEDIISRRELLGSAEDTMIVDFAEASAKSGRVART